MELNKQHREKLIWILDEINEEINIIERRIQTINENKKKNPKKNELIRSGDCADISLFLAQQRKELIVQSLINGDIDF